jgi:glycosyltransferase involved in cell wall biosynthesis
MLNDIDIGVAPYKVDDFHNYTFLNRTYFYMASGRPILTNICNPSVRVFNETGAGLALDFSTIDNAVESIEQMIHSDTISMSRNGRKAVLEKYNWNVDAKKMIEFIQLKIKN